MLSENYFLCIYRNTMPYDTPRTQRGNRRAAYTARGSAARKSKISKNRTTVAKIQRKKYVPRIVKNTKSVYALARQVKYLQNAALGEYQKKSEWINWDKTANAATYPFDATRPFCFNLKQFIGGLDSSGNAQNTPFYSCNSIGNGTPFGRFVKWQMPSFGANIAVDAHWGDDDIVSKQVYKPLGTQVVFEFQYYNLPANTPDAWVRIDVIRPRKMLHQTLHHELCMPFGLGQFTKLVSNPVISRNTINKTYWHVVETKMMCVRNLTGNTRSFDRTITLNRSYKNDAPIRCDLDATAKINNQYPTFDMQVDPRQMEWVVISCGDVIPDTVKILRHCSWRDQTGTAA